MASGPYSYAVKLLRILAGDLPHLETLDNYARGHHPDPYMPRTADAEYKLLARRAVSNWMPLLENTPAQALYVDDFRRDGDAAKQDGQNPTETPGRSPEMEHWHRSGLDSKQAAVYRGSFRFGHSFTVTEKDSKTGKAKTRGLSALNTAAAFIDPANDLIPTAAITVTRWPNDDPMGVGRATMWDERNRYLVTFKGLTDEKSVTVTSGTPHGADECPVTRFAATVDLEGRTVGVVEPMIPLQDRLNQSVFDLLVAQTYGSFKVRYATGMAPPLQTQWYDADGKPVDAPADPTNPPTGYKKKDVPIPMDHNARRFLFAESHEARFGSLDETPLAGYIESIDMSIRHLAAVSQTPPHYLLGQIANISADALTAAETALARKVEEYRMSFGESWERVFRLAAQIDGIAGSSEDFEGEVLWRDMEQRSLSQAADALGKLGDQLEIPKKGLWPRVPGVTSSELRTWQDLKAQEPDETQAEALKRATAGAPPTDTSNAA